MRVEYLHEGSPNCPLLRFYGNNLLDFSTLGRCFKELGSGTLQHVGIHDLPGFEAIGRCTLTARVGQKNKGVSQVGPGQDFEWVLTREGWETVGELTEPFLELRKVHMHQWFAGKDAKFGLEDSRISILLSNSEAGQW